MATEKLLIDANGSYTLNECNETGHSLCFGGGFIDVYDQKGKHICQFWAGDAPTVDAVVFPCKIGDTVHRKDGSWDVVGFECDRTGSWKVKLERWKNQFRDYHETTKVSFKSFGKTVFLTREEATAALAKMDGDWNA